MYLLHRIDNQTSGAMQTKLLNKENKLSIGYAAFVQAGEGGTLITHAQQMSKSDFAVYFGALGHTMELPWATRTRSHWLYYFLQIQAGDTIIVPGLPTATDFTVYEAVGTPQAVPTVAREHDIGFTVAVKKVATEPMTSAGPTLQGALHFRGMDLLLCGRAAQEVDALVAHRPLPTELPDPAAVAAVQGQLQSMPLDQLTKMVGRYFSAIGAIEVRYPSTETTQIDDDETTPVDVIGVFPALGAVVFAHVQQYAGTVPEEGIQDLVGFQYTTFSGYDVFAPVKWFVTTGHLPESEDEAVGYVQENQVQVIQGDSFAQRLVKAGVDVPL